jgi:hypothetical protein
VSYVYEEQKSELFTDSGQRLFVAVRDQVRAMMDRSGAVRAQEAIALPHGIGAADSWTLLACLDRMVELDELQELERSGYVAGQHRVFVAGAKWRRG